MQPFWPADKVLRDCKGAEQQRLSPKSCQVSSSAQWSHCLWRSMNERFKKEQKLEAKFNAEAQITGSAAGMDLGEFESKWQLYWVFHECCVEGSPADEVQQRGTGSVHRSVLPGMQQPKATDVSGGQPCVCVCASAFKCAFPALCCSWLCM